MTATLRDRIHQFNFAATLVAAAVLALAFLLGQRASPLWLGLLVAAAGGLALLARPALGLLALVLAALVVPLEIGTGTQVKLNAAGLLIPALAGAPERFAAGVLRRLADPDLVSHLRVNARRLVEQRYDWEQIGRRFAALVEETAAARRPLSDSES